MSRRVSRHPHSSHASRAVWVIGCLMAVVAALPDRVDAEPQSGQGDVSAQRIEIESWKLDNGLQVLFAAHRRIPAVTVQLWYHVGSKNEWVGVRGVAHMFEHMMFKGSTRVPPERHAQLLAAVGGNVNAFTSRDVTAYHNTLPRQYLDFAMELEAERMRNLMLTDATIASEREVVKEEKRLRQDNSPLGRGFEALYALAFEKHPYAWTPAGKIADLNAVTKQICQRFYDRYYIPNNATLVVVGDVRQSAVKASARRHFGRFAAGAPPPRVEIVEPPQKAQRRQRADWPSQHNVLLGAYHVPAASHPDTPALTVLSYILSAGRSSRLHQALVRKGQLAVQAGGAMDEAEHPGLFFIYALGLPQHALEPMERVLLTEVERIAQNGVNASELEKARNQLATRNLSRLETVYGLAYQIGRSQYVLGDPRAFLSEVDRLDRVTPADVQRVAAKYLRRDNLSLVVIPAQKGEQS
jgi:zinc protease